MNQSFVNLLLGIVLVYYMLLQGSLLGLAFLGSAYQRRYHRGVHVGDWDRIGRSPTTLPFSVIIPAFNEDRVIISTVNEALALDYPMHEVLVVNDGSTDHTLAKLIDYFGLSRVSRSSQVALKSQPVRGAYASPRFPKLLVLDKDNGRRADAINAGANYAQYPLLCLMDADCVFENDALMRAVHPFLESSRVVAATGVVRPANGVALQNGRLVDFSLPRGWWGLIQAVEYLRSLQWIRLGLARLGSMVGMPGAFLVVKRNVFLSMRGLDPTAIADDIDFTVRLQRFVHENHDNNGFKLKVAHIPDPVAYTEVPERFGDYVRQRNRWQRGVLQATFRNLSMMFNPRYGVAGMLAMPYFFLFQTLSGLVEVASYGVVLAAALLGYASWAQAGVFFLLAVGLGVVVSLAAVLLQEKTRHRAQTQRDMDRLMVACVLDNLGFHQLNQLVRTLATFDFLVRHKAPSKPIPRPEIFREVAPPSIGTSG